ncbi:MAG: DUF1573 domain-containing protein [Bdellovibrionota bacterium]|nr:MAG: DUF1573 domain-containing protein [Bdellovibrionota bacterium]
MRFRSLSLIVVILGFLAVPAIVLAQGGRPRAAIGNKVHEFGSVSQGTKVEHDFVIRNDGDADLLIHEVIPSCGCTASATSAEKISPGSEGVIKVSFDTAGFSGEKLKTVRVHTNDPDESALVLTLRGTIEADVVIEPRRVFFGDIVQGDSGATRTQTVSVKVREGSKSAITGVRTMSKYLSVREKKSAARERILEVEVAPDTPRGELRERIIVSVSGTRESSINVPVFAAIKGPIRLKPSTLSFGILEGQQVASRAVKVENIGAQPVKVTSARSSDSAVSVAVKEIKPGTLYVLDVSVDPSRVKKELRASIEVTTDSRDDERLSFTVYGILPPKA